MVSFSSSPPSLTILETSQISPPKGSVPEISLSLTFFDVPWLKFGPVERLFFYPFPYPTSHFIDSFLPPLKSSLSTTLQTFFPLAATLQQIPGSDGDFELRYSDGDSVSLTVAESVDGTFDILSGSNAREISILRPLLPHLPTLAISSPLLAIQVTVFPGDGVVIGTSLHHVACDGTSSIQFMHSWASACRSGGSAAETNIPIIDRSLIPDPGGRLYKLYRGPAPITLGTKPFSMTQSDVFLVNFTITKAHLNRLREAILAKTDHEKPFHLSTFVVTFAYVWIGFVKLREYLSQGRKRAHICFSVNFRARIEPALPPAYFGNCVGSCFVEADVGELVGGDGIKVAAEAIGRAVEGLKGSFQSAHEWPAKFVYFVKEQAMGVAGSPKFRVYDVDFGWGRPGKVEIASIAESGSISFTESREDPGGVELGFALPQHGVEFFDNYLANGLN